MNIYRMSFKLELPYMTIVDQIDYTSCKPTWWEKEKDNIDDKGTHLWVRTEYEDEEKST